MIGTQKKNKLMYLALNVAIGLSLVVVSSFTIFAGSMIQASSNIADKEDFTYTNGDGHVFKCYQREGHHGEVEIGWGGATDTLIENVNVPRVVTNGLASYTVTSVAQGGFRYCQFQNISLPDTVNEINEEAFAYCTRMEKFILPYGVTEIKNSTFIDCRSMEYFFYKDSAYNPSAESDPNVVVTNDKVTSIGDHAFDSCVSLTDFTCSTVLRSFGVSCFQNCTTLSRFYLPSKTGTGDGINTISISSYAFADCANLNWVYFEANLTSVDDYAFVDCKDSMVFHYGYEGTYPGDPSFSTYWRRKRLQSSTTSVYSIETDHIVILQSNQYPGLKYTIEEVDRNLDCHRDSTPQNQRHRIIKGSDGKYAVIYQWNPPTIKVADYWDPLTGALEIPGEVQHDGVNYPLKVINRETFANKTEIRSVKFNSGLVQICRRAFYKCNLISNLDFSECDTLIEISNDIFNHKSSGTVNDVMTTLTLPNSLEFIGKYAFYGFRKISYLSFKTHPDQPGHLRCLGGYSFGRIGESYKAPTIDIVLPCTLDDQWAVKANINYDDNKDYNTCNWGAIGPYCFGAESGKYTAMKRISMEECEHWVDPEDHSQGTIHQDANCSVAQNAFNRAKYLTKFVASSNMFLVGNEAFKNCENLREIFLTTKRARDAGYDYPFGTNAGDGSTYEISIVAGDSKSKSPELVIYLDGPAPGNINSSNGQTVIKWNAEGSVVYQTDFGYSPSAYQTTQSRSNIPTIYNVDFDFASDSILYYKPSTKTFLDEAPSLLTDYNSGIIALARQKNSSDYTIARYFTNESNVTDEIDLSQITKDGNNISNHITEIGPEAFGRDGYVKIGFYFVLPYTITKIDERAFYRQPGNAGDTGIASAGVRIVTYRDSTGVIQPSTATYEAVRDQCKADGAGGDGPRAGITGYCNLPNALTYLGKNAFYNNAFGSVVLGSNLTHIGKSAFYTHPNTGSKNGRSKLTSITIGSNSLFEVVNDGLYYKGTNRTLLYQAQNNNTTLTIPNGTKAIGMSACAGTTYTKITLNNDLKTIYGSAFQYSIKLTEVAGGTGLQYIGAIAPDDEVYSDSLPFDNVDFRDRMDYGEDGNKQSRLSAFQDCPVLTTVNFKDMTNLKKIGHAAFKNCGNLEQCANGASYSYYNASGTSTTLKETITTGVIDLSGATGLKSIGREAFSSKKIKYFHIPETGGELAMARDADHPWYDKDDQGKVFSAGTPAFLVGDNANHSCTKVTYTWAYKNRRANWTNLWFGSSSVYYHVDPDNAETDILSSGAVSDIKYWTEKDGGGYILFENQSQADTYFGVVRS